MQFDGRGVFPDQGARENRILRLRDGRMLGYGDYGDPDGVPVFGFHGTPGSRLMFRVADESARDAKVRLLAPERPGFGISTYQKDRTLASYARDIADFADALGIERFALAGVSGGAPYAVAAAALLPDRVTALALVSPVGPMAGPEATRIGPGHYAMFRVAPRAPALLWPFFSVGRRAFLHAPMVIYGFLMSRAAPADWRILTKREVRRNLVQGIAEGVRPGVRSSIQEMRLFSRPWDIPFAAIRAPTKLWQGLSDRNVPVGAAFRLGELIPGCEVQRVDKAGHYWILDNSGEVLRWVAEAARGDRAQAGRAGEEAAEALN